MGVFGGVDEYPRKSLTIHCLFYNESKDTEFPVSVNNSRPKHAYKLDIEFSLHETIRWLNSKLCSHDFFDLVGLLVHRGVFFPPQFF
jgi:hypothetical protein